MNKEEKRKGLIIGDIPVMGYVLAFALVLTAISLFMIQVYKWGGCHTGVSSASEAWGKQKELAADAAKTAYGFMKNPAMTLGGIAYNFAQDPIGEIKGLTNTVAGSTEPGIEFWKEKICSFANVAQVSVDTSYQWQGRHRQSQLYLSHFQLWKRSNNDFQRRAMVNHTRRFLICEAYNWPDATVSGLNMDGVNCQHIKEEQGGRSNYKTFIGGQWETFMEKHGVETYVFQLRVDDEPVIDKRKNTPLQAPIDEVSNSYNMPAQAPHSNGRMLLQREGARGVSRVNLQ